MKVEMMISALYGMAALGFFIGTLRQMAHMRPVESASVRIAVALTLCPFWPVLFSALMVKIAVRMADKND